jgi:hypothetical protein
LIANNTENQGIWLVYNYFGSQCTLVHDPEFGLNKNSDDGSGSGNGNGNNNGITFSTSGNFVINVPGNGNQPRYTFYLNGTNVTTYYSVRFQKMFEVDGQGNQVPSSQLSLSSVAFDWSSTSSTADGFNFNITASNQKNVPFTSLILANHLLNASSTNNLKFDVIISGYQWISPNSSLVLQFTLSTSSSMSGAASNSTNSALSGGGSSISTGDAFFSITPSATCGSASISATLTANSASDSPGIWLTYGHFNSSCTLVHDPEIGINGGKGHTWIWIVVGVVGGVLVAAIVVFFVIRGRRRSGYDHV